MKRSYSLHINISPVDKTGLQQEGSLDCPISHYDHNKRTVRTMPTGSIIDMSCHVQERVFTSGLMPEHYYNTYPSSYIYTGWYTEFLNLLITLFWFRLLLRKFRNTAIHPKKHTLTVESRGRESLEANRNNLDKRFKNSVYCPLYRCLVVTVECIHLYIRLYKGASIVLCAFYNSTHYPASKWNIEDK